ncbi:MAG: hypothetical protein M1833_002214 [Piccolia ochrophora]|nr:MAG: hypothetical protein M1833_002214 [Piccolia ochrophora]
MDGPIELPPEANPLTPQILYNVLRSAASGDPQQIQTGAKQLQQWETEKGYYSLLQDVFQDKGLPVEIRYLAIIQLKNGIDKYWRKTATNAVNRDEKSHIRSRLLQSGIDEADRRLALQNALVIAKIVRFEFPNDWPDVVNSVIALLRSSSNPGANPMHLPRTLLILLHIIKELSTARLQRSKASLQSVSPEIFFVLGRVYVDKVRRWRSFLEDGGNDEGGAMDDIELSLLAIKVLRRLLVSGFEFPNRDKDVQEFWTVVRNQFGDLLAIVTREPQVLTADVHHWIERHVIQFSKLHLEMARMHPAAFALLPDSVALVKAYWDLVADFGETFGSKSMVIPGKIRHGGEADDNDKPLLEQLSLKGLLIVRACVKMVFNPMQTFRYRRPEDKEEEKQATHLMRSDLLTEGLVRNIMEKIVTGFFVFRETDLREWEEEPEEWERREEGEGDGWEFSIRPCSEKLFLDLIINFKDLLIQPLLNVFYGVATPESSDIIFKDSVYTAIGLSASVLHQHLDFDAFLTSTLVTEVQKTQPGGNILRRRIAVLLGQWISVKISGANRPLVYQIFQHLLNKDDPLNDQVVRVTAGKQFSHVADDWGFEVQPFLPYTSNILGGVMALIEEAELTETKMALLNTVSVIVERLEHHISPYAEKIVALLPPLWEQSAEEHLMKGAILTILTKLITSMKDESRRYHPLVLPLIKHAIEPGSETQVYLLEDALDLWAAMLVQTASPASADILSLSHYLFPILELGTEHFRKALEITESYVLLAPTHMLDTSMRTQLFTTFTSLLGTLKPEANGVIMHLIETIIRSAASLTTDDRAVSAIATTLVDTHFLTKLLAGLRNAHDARQTTGPNRKAPPLETIVETDYFSVLARLALASTDVFGSALHAASAAAGEDVAHTLAWLLPEWFHHFGNVGHPTQRKLNCLALTKLLETGQPWILSRLQDLMTVWTDVVTELQEGAEERGGDSLIYWDPTSLKPPNPEAPEDERRRHLTFTDPIHTLNINTFIATHLQQMIARAGGEDRFRTEWLVNVDREVVEGFGRLGVWS